MNLVAVIYQKEFVTFSFSFVPYKIFKNTDYQEEKNTLRRRKNYHIPMNETRFPSSKVSDVKW